MKSVEELAAEMVAVVDADRLKARADLIARILQAPDSRVSKRALLGLSSRRRRAIAGASLFRF
jgi:hypothetical protein